MYKQIKYSDLIAITEQLDGMLAKHVQWLTLMHKTIVCQKTVSDSALSNHKICDFGKWYYSVSIPELAKSPIFIELGVVHKELHERANCILNQYESNIVVDENEYDLFVLAEKNFFDILNNLIENVLTTKSQFDPLTNIPNRCLVKFILEKEYSKVLRMKSECCIAFADIDFFKQVNDNYGHAAGDKVLVEISQFFSNSIRPYDTVGRYGGEEFIFCFPQTNLKDAKVNLERMRRGLEELTIITDESHEVKVTCSFGLAQMNADDSLEEIVKQADYAMYEAKIEGRNRVSVSERQ